MMLKDPTTILGRACIGLAALVCCRVAPIVRAADVDFAASVKPLLTQHCVRCHGDTKQEGDLRIDVLPVDFVNLGVAAHWTEIMDRINSGEMPPKKEPRPKAEDVALVAEWIAAQLTEAEASRQAATGELVSFRRLSREEYRNTIRDLLGVTYDASDPTGLPEDPDWQGFERIGSVLTISPTHVEKYLAAAELVLCESLALGPQPQTETTLWTAAKLRQPGDVTVNLAARGILDKVRADIVPNNGALDAAELKIATAGQYRVRVKVSGLRPANDRAARLRLYATSISRTLFEQDVEAPEDQPVTLEFQTHLPAGTHLIRIVNAVPGPNPEGRPSRPLGTKPFFKMKARQPWQIKLTDDEFKPIWPTLLLDWIEWEGPVQESWPPPAHRQLFFAGDSATKDLAYAREILSRFATRAYRRPVQPAEVERLVQLVAKAQQLGDNFESSVKTGLLAVLCSKNFIYLVEGSADAPSPRLNDWELASRLSYFLWSTMPDERLMELARAGTLHQSRHAAGRSAPHDAGPESGCVCRVVPPPVAAAAARRHVRAGQEALSRLRRISGKEHGRRDHRLFPRGARAQSRAARVPRFRLDHAQRAPGRALRHRGRARRAIAAGGAEAARTIAAGCSPRPRSSA